MTLDYRDHAPQDQIADGIELSRKQVVRDWLAFTAIHNVDNDIVESGLDILETVEGDRLLDVAEKLTAEVLARTVVVTDGMKDQVAELRIDQTLNASSRAFIEKLCGSVDESALRADDAAPLAESIVDLWESTRKNKRSSRIDHAWILEMKLMGMPTQDIVEAAPFSTTVSSIPVAITRMKKEIQEVYSPEEIRAAISLALDRDIPARPGQPISAVSPKPSQPRVEHSRPKEHSVPSRLPESWEKIGRDLAGHLQEISDSDELDWQEKALCAQTDPEVFFPDKGGSTREAKRVCLTCDVRTDCLDYAVTNDERFGIWGGLSERERRKLKRKKANIQ